MDHALVLILGQKMGNGFLDLGVGQLRGDVFGNVTVEGQEMEKLAQGPDPRFAHVHRRCLKVGGKLDNLQIADMLE